MTGLLLMAALGVALSGGPGETPRQAEGRWFAVGGILVAALLWALP